MWFFTNDFCLIKVYIPNTWFLIFRWVLSVWQTLWELRFKYILFIFSRIIFWWSSKSKSAFLWWFHYFRNMPTLSINSMWRRRKKGAKLFCRYPIVYAEVINVPKGFILYHILVRNIFFKRQCLWFHVECFSFALWGELSRKKYERKTM